MAMLLIRLLILFGGIWLGLRLIKRAQDHWLDAKREELENLERQFQTVQELKGNFKNVALKQKTVSEFKGETNE